MIPPTTKYERHRKFDAYNFKSSSKKDSKKDQANAFTSLQVQILYMENK